MRYLFIYIIPKQREIVLKYIIAQHCSRVAQGGSDRLPKVPLAGRAEAIQLARFRQEVVLITDLRSPSGDP